ncbi:hypothetical protein [Streptomyces sp. NK15101]|uniref:hypothetical protein n=1 Tax=Streptomyces sp. NK15101 TaxID=2873261 RepID=UPI001CED5055|nr:hypothetical protein [Streptomyces sp. NK15101]
MDDDLVRFLQERLDEEADLARRCDGDTWPCADLLDLASPYADHPDFPGGPAVASQRAER